MTIRSYEGTHPLIDAKAWIDPAALVIGDVGIGEESSLWPYAVARGDVNRIRIGCRTNIQDHSVLHVSHAGPFNPGGTPLTIGNGVTVGHRVILHACAVGDDCLIGMGAILMDEVTVENGVIVGAGSLVPPGRTLESGFLYVGSPARRSRELTARERAYLAYSANHYVRLARQHSACAV